MTDPLQMHRGYVAMIDILGWKGIWKRHQVAKILATVDGLRRMEQGMRNFTEAVFGSEGSASDAPSLVRLMMSKEMEAMAAWPPAIRQLLAEELGPVEGERYLVKGQTAFLSDTLVVACCPNPAWATRSSTGDYVARLWVVATVALALRTCLLSDPPFLFRGAIASGEYLVDQNLILGPAVDGAATLMNQANASVVWFAPDVPADVAPFVEPTQVPLHGGSSVRVPVINPFAVLTDVPDARERMLAAFGTAPLPLDVVIKKQNTEVLLDSLSEAWQRVLANAHPPPAR